MKENFSGKSFFSKIYEKFFFRKKTFYLCENLDVPDGMLWLTAIRHASLLASDLLPALSVRGRATLRPPLIKLNLVDRPHRALHVLNAHKAFVER